MGREGRLGPPRFYDKFTPMQLVTDGQTLSLFKAPFQFMRLEHNKTPVSIHSNKSCFIL